MMIQISFYPLLPGSTAALNRVLGCVLGLDEILSTDDLVDVRVASCERRSSWKDRDVRAADRERGGRESINEGRLDGDCRLLWANNSLKESLDLRLGSTDRVVNAGDEDTIGGKQLCHRRAHSLHAKQLNSKPAFSLSLIFR